MKCATRRYINCFCSYVTVQGMKDYFTIKGSRIHMFKGSIGCDIVIQYILIFPVYLY